MYTRMLVPLDGSNVSEVVLEYAVALARRLSLNLMLLHVCEQENAEMAPMHRAYVNQAVLDAKRQIEDIQTNRASETGPKALKVQGEMTIGDPAEEIIRIAEERKADLILMATRSHSGVSERAVGDVTKMILLNSKVPVWLMPASISGEIVHDGWQTRTFLVPLDGSKTAESALPHVESVTKMRGADLITVTLLRVCETEFGTSDQASECKDYLQNLEKRFHDAGVRAQSAVEIGTPAEAIINYAQRHPFNLVIMSTHGQSGVTRRPYGSVAGKVLMRISSPILMVRPR